MAGCQLVIQMIVGRKTQYLTAAQGILKTIEKQLITIIHNFVWNNNSLQVHFTTLLQPIADGGLNVLNIKACNQAIDIMSLKSYLNHSLSCSF